MTNKNTIFAGLVVVVLVFGLVNFIKADGNPGKYIFENFSGNFYDSGEPAPTPEQELGAIEFNTGKIVYDNLSESILVRDTIVLTASETNNLYNVPKILIPSVGVDHVILVDSIVGFRKFSSESWNRTNN